LPAWQLAAVPSLVFLVQERIERLLQDGSMGWLVSVEPAVIAGVALQLLCGLFALCVGCTLLTTSPAYSLAVPTSMSIGTRRATLVRPSMLPLLRLPAPASRHAGRAPPVLA
jgi:hypothetical protein